MRKLLLTLRALVLLAVGCDDHVFPGDAAEVQSCRREPALTYENFGEGFLAKFCTGCHSSLQLGEQRAGAPAGVDFDTWDGVLQWSDRIRARTLDDQDMPPAGFPSAEELARFDEWLTCEVAPLAAEVQ